MKAKRVAFWALTIVIAWEMVAGSTWDLLEIPFTRAVLDRLGYPHYLLLILGAWKLPCAMAWLAPRFARLKEWAYAGAFFNYTGAAASHVLAHDRVSAAIGPAVFAAMTLGSWALRPPQTEPARPRAWIASAVALAAMLAISLATLPKGTS